jgi:hypothetical protein
MALLVSHLDLQPFLLVVSYSNSLPMIQSTMLFADVHVVPPEYRKKEENIQMSGKKLVQEKKNKKNCIKFE